MLIKCTNLGLHLSHFSLNIWFVKFFHLNLSDSNLKPVGKAFMGFYGPRAICLSYRTTYNGKPSSN